MVIRKRVSMFTASNGAYRRTKIVIDAINIGIGVAVVIMATVIFLVPGNWDFLLPLVFMAGAVMNGLHSVRKFLKFESRSGVIQMILAIALLVTAIASGIVLWN